VVVGVVALGKAVKDLVAGGKARGVGDPGLATINGSGKMI
jgi:hypothetical protein